MKNLMRWAFVGCALVAVIGPASNRASAALKLRDVCTVMGQQEVHLTGLGLVTGLEGTGDNKFSPTLNVLRTLMGNLNDRDPKKNTIDVNTLAGSKNVALVLVHAVIPARGIAPGQKLDCTVTALGSATSLRGGQLISTPLSDFSSLDVMGLARGALRVRDDSAKTRGSIPLGFVASQELSSRVIHRIGDKQGFYLMIRPSRASFRMAREVADLVNKDTQSESYADTTGDAGQLGRIAVPRSEGVVEVVIPDLYQSTPLEFLSIVLDIRMESNTSESRVVVNKTTKSVVITGDVVISPVVLTHNQLQISVGEGATYDPFVTLSDPRRAPDDQTPVTPEERKLEELLGAMQQLKLPADDIIDVVLSLEKAGVLHARVIVNE